VALSVFDIILLARKSLHRGFALAASPEDMRAVEAVIAELGLDAFASRDIGTLSGGQRQLAAIGQALVREPDVLLLDEPTSALDVRRQLDVMATIREATRRRGIVTVAAIHDLSLAARFADRVLVMNGGRIARAGAPAEVLAHPAVSETYAVGVHLERSARGTLLVEPYIRTE
jgi:iron complex transport system ATP-binding protein